MKIQKTTLQIEKCNLHFFFFKASVTVYYSDFRMEFFFFFFFKIIIKRKKSYKILALLIELPENIHEPIIIGHCSRRGIGKRVLISNRIYFDDKSRNAHPSFFKSYIMYLFILRFIVFFFFFCYIYKIISQCSGKN